MKTQKREREQQPACESKRIIEQNRKQWFEERKKNQEILTRNNI